MRRFGLIFSTAFVLALIVFAAPTPVHAQSRIFPTGYWGPLLSCTGNYVDASAVAGVSDHKTCNDVCDLLHTGQNVIDFAMTLVLFVGAPLMVTFGGILLLTAGGADEKRTMAKDIIVSAVVGIIITLGAYVILSTFLWLTGNANSDAKVSWPVIQCVVDPAPVAS